VERGYDPLTSDKLHFTVVRTVRANWRIAFRFEGTNVLDVELIDYH
jgi:plasmid maintenance system killer protein